MKCRDHKRVYYQLRILLMIASISPSISLYLSSSSSFHFPSSKITPTEYVRKRSILKYAPTTWDAVSDDFLGKEDLDTATRRRRSLERLDEYSSKVLSPTQISSHTMKEKIRSGEFPEHYVPINGISVKKEKGVKLPGLDYLPDNSQQNAITSDAPAVLLESGAGTGKTSVLARRIAYLIEAEKVLPQNMIVLSFTRRDANALRDMALDILSEDPKLEQKLEEIEKKMWSGTIHSFAINILRAFFDSPVRVISTREMRERIRQCLQRICSKRSRNNMLLYKQALDDSNQGIWTLVHYIMRCIELWKEAGVMTTPYAYSIKFKGERNLDLEDTLSKEDLVEIAMRLGVPYSAALLALEISGEYQSLHASSGTADPSDVASMAYDLLLRNPEYLNKVRSKLHHVILDEYQDVSVAQHKLLKLLIRGVIESSSEGTHSKSHVPVLLDHKRTKLRTSETVCLNVPKCFCAGDVNQSIYGWRGAAPLLTVDGFRKDFPQGLVIPLQMNYRLPRQILNAADILLGREDTDFSSSKHVTAHSSDISPSAAKSASTMVTECLSDTNKVDHHVDQLLKESILNESRCSVFIKGLWDIREEAKYIASKILSRSNERVSSLEKTLKKHSNGICKESKNFLFDSTDVAIMLRSSKHMKLFEEALRSYRIPYTKSNDSSSNTRKDQRLGVTHKPKSRAIKPVKLITMHGGKGDEFDDVYLAGWTEGVFPQKSAMQSNRLHEERRIAYVALTRARQSVLLTYSFVNRIPYFGPLGERKEVTEQAEPSRFLHDLMPKEKNSSNGIKSHEVEWCNKIGFKEVVAGQNLPDHFSKAYRVPVGYKTRDLFKGTPLKKESMPSDESCQSNTLDKVYTGLRSINDGERGSCKKYRIIFREILKEIGITKGSAIVFKDKMKAETKAMDALVDAHTDDVMSRALSRCTAKELGLYIVYLLFKNK